MRDLLNLIDTVLAEATLTPAQITKYPERFDAFIAHIQNNKPFYTEDGDEVVLKPSEAARFLKLKAADQFKGNLMGVDAEGNQWPLSKFRKTAEFGGASSTPGDEETGKLSKEGAQVKPKQIGITDQAIPAQDLGNMIVNNPVLQSTEYGQVVIQMAQQIMNGEPATMPTEIRKNEKIKKAIVDYAGEYLGVLALVSNQSEFPSKDKFLQWLGGDITEMVLSFPSKENNPIADSFGTITNPSNNHTLNISSKGTGGGAAPSMSSLKIPDHLRGKKEYQTAMDLIDLTQNPNLPKPRSVSSVFQAMNLLHERMPESIPKDFVPFLPWDQSIVAQVTDSLKKGTPMPKYRSLFEKLDSKGNDGGKLTYVTKAAVMNIVNGGKIPEFQAVVLEILDFNFIQQYATASGNTVKFYTQWPAKLDGEVTMETKSGGTDPSKGGFSFKLKPKGAPVPSAEPFDATDAAIGSEPAHMTAKDLDAVTQTPRLKGPGARAARAPAEPNMSPEVLGRKSRI
jgi:hypothetical protein